MLEVFSSSESWIALTLLTFLEIVLGIDNIIFISIVAERLPSNQRNKARITGLSLALLFRILMLFSITWIIGFTNPLFEIFNHSVSGRDLILFGGGLFLLAKTTSEIHHKIEEDPEDRPVSRAASFWGIIGQIILLDIVFSFDSILTAIGMTNQLILMIIAVVIAMIIMMIFAGKISRFINQHPTLQMLALSFLILIGVMLIVESFGVHVPKGYIYFAVAFSLFVELLNMRLRKKMKKQVKPVLPESPSGKSNARDK